MTKVRRLAAADGKGWHKSIQFDGPPIRRVAILPDARITLVCARTFVAAVRSRRDLALENLVLRHQLQVALRTNPHPQLRASDRVLWLWLRHVWPQDWRQHLHVVRPETVLRWHRKGWRLYWTWKSRTRLGRPRLSAELKTLIGRISQENPLWGTERIRGELLKLGIVVSNRSIRRYRWRRGKRGPYQYWRTFLANQLRGIWAADLFVVQTVSFRTLYIFFCINHERRELIHFNVIASLCCRSSGCTSSYSAVLS